MKKLTIKARVTLWYTVFMTLLALSMLALLLALSSSQALSTMEGRLRSEVMDCLEDLSEGDEDSEPDFDDIDSFRDGVYLSIYDSEGRLLFGKVPGGFDNTAVFAPDQLKSIRSGNIKWSVYDSTVELNGYGRLWIRGIASQTETEAAFQIILRLAAVALPLFLFLVALGGYLITKRAFRPVGKIAETAEEISAGSNLTRRIQLGEGKDEVFQLADAFDRMLDRLQASFDKEKQFTSDVSHELRTPTSVIISQCEYAIEHSSSREELLKSLEIILGQSQKMARLISQLLTLARADKGTARLYPERVNISELTELTAEEQRGAAEEKGIEILTKIQPGLELMADETMLMRLWINLISNAVRYGRNGGYVEVGLSGSGSEITGWVKDNGIGISPENLPKIWDRFFQADPSRSSNIEGSMGLGLPMVRWIVEAHSGTIHAESRLGDGSLFVFRLPVKK